MKVAQAAGLYAASLNQQAYSEEEMYGLIRADHLSSWASRYAAPSEFPRLIRLLIRSMTNPRAISFPADEAVRLAGYDGQLELDEATSGIPSGVSVWELGTDRNVRVKADGDYSKRTEDPKSVDPADTTFVFVTPRSWPGKAAWMEARQAEGLWKAVLAFDAEDLVQWLEVAPAVAAWFGRLAGIVPQGVQDLDGALEDYRSATQPEFDPAGTLIGRKDQVETLLRALTGPPTAIQLQASSQEEGVAFIGSSIRELPFDQQDSVLARCLCIANADALRQVCTLGSNFVLIVGEDVTPLPAESRLHIIIRVVRHATGGEGTIELAEPNMRELFEWVHEQGIDRNDAYRLCCDADGNLERVRRNFLRAGPPLPAWAQLPTAAAVAPAVLLGAWEARNAADQATVQKIAGTSTYDQFEETLGAWMSGANPLMTRAGDLCRVYRRTHARKYLEPFLRTGQLEAFKTEFLEVMLEADSRFDSPVGERWLLSNRRAHSGALRTALTETVLILAVEGDARNSCFEGRTAQSWADRVLSILYSHREEPNFWRRIRSELAELAEASPDQFLSALESDLASARPQVLDLFEDEGDHGSCLHAGLLWALEALYWNPVYLGRTARLLARLTRLDPGGRWGNRPRASLFMIFNPMQPQCTVAAQERQQLLRALAAEFPDVAVGICVKMIESRDGFIDTARKPTIREWAPRGPQSIAMTDYSADVDFAGALLLSIAGQDVAIWYELLSNLKQFCSELVERIFGGIEQLLPQLEQPARLKLRKDLRRLLHHHNQFLDAEKVPEWLYTQDLLNSLGRLYEALKPSDPVDANAWLFDFWPELPFETSTNWDWEKTSLNALQRGAVGELLALGLPVIIERMSAFKNPHALGFILASVAEGRAMTEQLLSAYGEAEDGHVQDFIRGFRPPFTRLSKEDSFRNG